MDDDNVSDKIDYVMAKKLGAYSKMNQELEILGQLARQFNDVHGSASPVHFIFCGDGVSRRKLEDQCSGLNFILFLDLQPAESLSEFLRMADIHLAISLSFSSLTIVSSLLIIDSSETDSI